MTGDVLADFELSDLAHAALLIGEAPLAVRLRLGRNVRCTSGSGRTSKVCCPRPPEPRRRAVRRSLGRSG
jgi:hypothetical protein